MLRFIYALGSIYEKETAITGAARMVEDTLYHKEADDGKATVRDIFGLKCCVMAGYTCIFASLTMLCASRTMERHRFCTVDQDVCSNNGFITSGSIFTDRAVERYDTGFRKIEGAGCPTRSN